MATQDDVLQGDEAYYDERPEGERGFDASLLARSLKTLPTRRPLVHSRSDSVTEAVRAMQREQRGCVLITEDGTPKTRLVGIFSERDVLNRIVGPRRSGRPARRSAGDMW